MKNTKFQSMEFEFQCADLKQGDPLPGIFKRISDFHGIENYHASISMILSELVSNALDHGILKLESSLKKDADGFEAYYVEKQKRLEVLEHGYIKVSIHKDISELGEFFCISVEDSGEGFETEADLQQLEGNIAHSGRGIQLLRKLCSEISYNRSGNRVMVRFCCGPHS